MEKFRLIKVYNLFYASRQKKFDTKFSIKKCQVEILGLQWSFNGFISDQYKKIFILKNYPNFIIFKPHKITIEYKKSSNGSVVKQAIGQCIMHTLCDEFEFVYCLFQDENKKRKFWNQLIMRMKKWYCRNSGMITTFVWNLYN